MLLMAIAMFSTAVGSTIVEVGKAKYRVTVKDEEVKVVSKAIVGNRSRERHDQMHQAVRQVTGCTLVDESWHDATLVGKLDCSASAQPAN